MYFIARKEFDIFSESRIVWWEGEQFLLTETISFFFTGGWILFLKIVEYCEINVMLLDYVILLVLQHL